MLVRLLLVADSPLRSRRWSRLLDDPAVLIAHVGTKGTFWERLTAETFDLLLVDHRRLPAPNTEAIEAVRQLPDEPDIVVVSDEEDPEERARLLAAGCMAVVYAGIPDSTMRNTFRSLAQRRRSATLQRMRAQKAETPHRLSDFVSRSASMLRLIDTAGRVARSDTSVLILGETGVGKEWLAHAIHEEGSRRHGPFTAVNCGAIPESLLESELFGHEEGAFTGARRAHRGYFELAHGGTVFLDEIGEIPPHLQVRLLRVLQEKKIRRVGSEREFDVDVRVVAATNRDLEAEIREGRFRTDLFYRIGVVTLTVPPLRERREDIPELIDNYSERYQVRLRRFFDGIEGDALDALIRYDWPGNVRELINIMERTVLLGTGEKIGLRDLPTAIAERAVPTTPPLAAGREEGAPRPRIRTDRPLRELRRETVESFERAYLEALLAETGGKIGGTAKRAGITPRALFEKMRRYGLRKEEYRTD